MLKKLLLGCLLVIIITAIAGYKTLNSLRMTWINSEVDPVISAALPVALNARFIGEKPYVLAKVNGEELLFLLDTGARFLMLFDTPKVKRLQLPKGFKLALSGWGQEKDTAAYQTDLEYVDLGGVRFNAIKAGYIPISSSPYFLREDEAFIDGVIGHDMLKHFVWTFDKASNQIALSTGSYQESGLTESLDLDIFFSKIKVAGQLAFNGSTRATGQFIIDTGSRHYLKISSQYPENRNIDIQSASITAADFGLNGMVKHQRVTLPELRLGNLKIPNIKTNLIPSNDEDEDDFWVIGNALLNQYKTVIDYPRKKLYLEPVNKFAVRYNLLGLELRKIRTGEFVVRYVFPDLPASEYDLRTGDLVTQLSGRSAKELSISQVIEMSSFPGQKEICIERDSLCFQISVKPIPGYSTF